MHAVLVTALWITGLNLLQAQDPSAIGHATRLLDLLGAGQFEEVAAEFNAKMAAAMPVSQLREVWTAVRQQAGALTSIVSQRVITGDRDETIGPNTPFRDLAWGLADRGIAVLRYEKRTRQHGAKIAGDKTFTVREETIADALLAGALTLPMLILQGERDYQVTLADLEGWRNAVGSRANVSIKSYPTLNHLFLPGEGKSTPSEYERAGHIPDVVLDDIATWLRTRAESR